MSAKTRFQFDVHESQVDEIKALMEDIGASSNRELFNNALTLLEWVVEEVKSGNKIASVNEDSQVYRELQMPALNRAARYSRDRGASRKQAGSDFRAAKELQS